MVIKISHNAILNFKNGAKLFTQIRKAVKKSKKVEIILQKNNSTIVCVEHHIVLIHFVNRHFGPSIFL
jgi:hypothetical protein